MSNLVVNPDSRFSHVKAHFITTDDVLAIDESESCDLEQARFCLRSYSVGVLMSPTFTQLDKLWICEQ